MKKVTTLAFIRDHNKILLGLKKRGFGAGRWNGFGGKVKPNETVKDTLVREFREECGIEVLSTEQFGLINFHYDDDLTMEVNFFEVIDYTGTPTESDEMKPDWFDVNALPFPNMWPDDQHWMPLFLAHKKFKGDIYFKGLDTISKLDLKEVNLL